MSADNAGGAQTATPVPLTETSTNARKIPQSIFIENTEAWVEKYGAN